MESFPPEVFINIFSKLPVKSLHNVKLVCKQWHNLARDPFLVNLLCSNVTENDQCLVLHCDSPVTNQLYSVHLYNHEENIGMMKNLQVPAIPEFDFIGSCNGLLCFSNHTDKNVFYVYNPVINRYAELPQATQYSDNWTSFGFGFSQSTKEYKLVKIARYRQHGVMAPSAVEILTLGSSTWRNLGETCYFPMTSSSQVLINGRLHRVNWPQRYHRGRMLVSFDLDTEQFQEVSRPDSAELEREQYELLVLGGCLSAAYNTGFSKWQIWTMKEYGLKESWINEFNIVNHVPRGLEQDIDGTFRKSKFYSRRYPDHVLCRLKNGEILLSCMCKTLVAYDPISDSFREIQIQGLPDCFEAIVHMSSLNWIENLTGV